MQKRTRYPSLEIGERSPAYHSHEPTISCPRFFSSPTDASRIEEQTRRLLYPENADSMTIGRISHRWCRARSVLHRRELG